MKKILFYLCFSVSFFIKAQQIDPLRTKDAQKQNQWVDSIYKKMTIDQKIGQLFMVQAFSTKKDKSTEAIKQLVEKYHIGGIIFSKGGPIRQAKLTNELQKSAKIPLLVAMDAEWGLAMRLDSTYAFPWNMTLGAIKNNLLIEKTGEHIAKHCQRMGVHLNFAPSIDINTNPANPIIGNRAFGEDKWNVAQKGIAFTKGMQSVGVLANAKHFPGHGDTSQDSHLTLPSVLSSKERLQQIEFYPFKELISKGVTTIMIGHLNVPALDKTGKPSSLSYPIITELLKQKMGFKGLIFTDALGMKGVANYSEPGEVDLQAFMAGNDMLLMPSDAIKGIQRLKKAYNEKKITESRLEYSVKKILKAKYWAGLNTYKPIEINNLWNDIHTKKDDLLTETLYENAITLATNSQQIIPLQNLEKNKTAFLKLGDDSHQEFVRSLNLYDAVPTLHGKKWEEIQKEIKNFDRIIIGFHKSNKSPWANFKFSSEEINLIQKISKEKKVILAIFTRPYALSDLDINNISSIIVSYQHSEIAQQKTAQIIYGAIDAKGNLPVSANLNLPVKTGIISKNIQRLQYGIPESVAMNSETLLKIDSVITDAISKKMTPSAQILVARHGRVIYNKAFGNFTYSPSEKVTDSTLYDLASLTKILATLPVLMQDFDQKKIQLSTPMGTLLPELKTSNKAHLKLSEILSHQAGLVSWIPFHRKTQNTQKQQIYSNTSDENFSIQVAENMFIQKNYSDTIFFNIANSKIIKNPDYLYSDLGFILLQKYLETTHKKDLNALTSENFYKKLGAFSLTYRPLEKFSKKQIAPTENDKTFRKQIIQGFVHDQTAAMLGGISGHAGLFGTANDVAKVMQLYLQKGAYGGIRYFSENTFNTFNTTHFLAQNNRRALGFDKSLPNNSGATCGCVSSESFGHTGFTGTFAWADPVSQIVYVFLSNRTFPDAENKKLVTEGIRSKIQQIIQNAIIP